jgi:adenylyltransferase/sulfurtransferase
MDATQQYIERYSRQLSLPEIGTSGQQKLKAAKVLVIGAGGLGCPVLQYLAAAGVGELGIADDDKVELSNLQRQILYTTKDIGLPKTQCAKKRILQLNPDILIRTYALKLDNTNIWDVLHDFEIIIDGTDNFPSRYLINDACVLLKKVLIYGSISRFEGQVAVFNVSESHGAVSANYRDLYPEPPPENEVPSCNQAGVLGVLPGMIGMMMASECIKYITGTGNLLTNKLLLADMLLNRFLEAQITPRAETKKLIPANRKAFEQKKYRLNCMDQMEYNNVNAAEFNQLMQQADTIVIDVREPGEQPIVTEFACINIPISSFKDAIPFIKENNVLLFCHSGIRSLKAAELLSGSYKKIYNLKGGIIRWKPTHH